MTITYYEKIVQGSEEWKSLRCGMLTASRMPKLLTPSLTLADNDDSRRIIFEIMVERLTGVVKDDFQSWAMRRGQEEEIYARALYSEKYAPVKQMGFVINDELGFPMGWSPDGLVGENGGIETKSRENDLQVKVIMDGVVPKENVIQVQSSLFVGRREWIDYNSYSNGMPMLTIKVEPIPAIQEALKNAAINCEKAIVARITQWHEIMSSNARLAPTERRNYEEEMH